MLGAKLDGRHIPPRLRKGGRKKILLTLERVAAVKGGCTPRHLLPADVQQSSLTMAAAEEERKRGRRTSSRGFSSLAGGRQSGKKSHTERETYTCIFSPSRLSLLDRESLATEQWQLSRVFSLYRARARARFMQSALARFILRGFVYFFRIRRARDKTAL